MCFIKIFDSRVLALYNFINVLIVSKSYFALKLTCLETHSCYVFAKIITYSCKDYLV